MSPLVHEPRTAPCVQEWFRRGTEPRCARRHRLAAGSMDDDAGWRPPRAPIQRAERHAFVTSGGSALLVVLAFGRRVDSDRKPMSAPEANAEQIRYWNEAAGPKWVSFQKVIDAQIAPLGERAMDRASIAPGERVIDVGCGCGDTTITLARRVGPAGLVLGIDISAPMLERAAETARAAGLANVRFENADAQTHRLSPGAFDVVYSRFGVMFFADPVAAFTNLRAALRPGGRLAFVCWRSLAENPLFTAPMAAAAKHLPPLPPPHPNAPDPFAFADRARVAQILETA